MIAFGFSFDDLVIGHPLQQREQHDFEQHPREVGSDATMHAEAEGGVKIMRPVDYEPVGVLELGIVPVCPSEGNQDAFAGRDCLPGHLYIARRGAGLILDGAVET